MSVQHDEFTVRPRWHRTGNACFPTAARVDGRWWVLRVNSFPDHPLWTLFVDGERRFDLDDAPGSWGAVAGDDLPNLDVDEAEGALAQVSGFLAYGSEVGEPCNNPFCCG
jgi:hypothetical protein